jgi:serine/threonine-protein kinase
MALLQEGKTIQDKWIVETFLGEGAFAEVYRVRHRIFGRQAMKVFKRTGMELGEAEGILQEAILLANMHHPNIIRVFDADMTETSQGVCCFFTMEYIAGGTLERHWKSFGDDFVPVPEVVEIARQVAAGLAAAHAYNPPIVHRDIKPQNILVGYDEHGFRACIADFGLAKKFNTLTWALTGLGTRCFKAPEVLANLKADSPAGDVWAVGMCLYLLLTDRFPFADDYGLEFAGNERFESPLKLPSTFNANVDDKLDELVYRCLSLNPRNRFQHAGELKSSLESWEPRSRIRKARTNLRKTSCEKPNLGTYVSTPDERSGREIAKEALLLSCHAGSLLEAADLMEEGFLKWSELREKYETKVTLWRKGISG